MLVSGGNTVNTFCRSVCSVCRYLGTQVVRKLSCISGLTPCVMSSRLCLAEMRVRLGNYATKPTKRRMLHIICQFCVLFLYNLDNFLGIVYHSNSKCLLHCSPRLDFYLCPLRFFSSPPHPDRLWAHRASCRIDTVSLLPGVEWSKREADHLSPPSLEVSVGSFMKRCSDRGAT
jgi:hypothetical protein